MSKKPRKKEETVETSTIFAGPALTMQEREARERQKKAEEKARLREQRRRMREEAKKNRTNDIKDRKQATVLVLVLIGFVMIGVVMLAFSNSGIGREAKLGVTYYIDETVVAKKSDEGITAEITQAYYTNNGGMYIYLSMANGMAVSQHPTRIHILLKNADDEVIVDAAATNITRDFYVIFNGYNSYEVFIPKKYVKIADDPLNKISYEITVDSVDYE